MMSQEDKQKLGSVTAWIFRVLTGVGAFFLIQTYNGITRTNELLQDIRREQAVNDTFYRMKLEQHERSLERHELWIQRHEPHHHP